MLDFRENSAAPLTVSQLTRRVKTLLENNFTAVVVTGEVTDFVAAASGHWYFSLKDGGAKLSVVMWRATTVKMAGAKKMPNNGEQITVHGEISVYEPRGNYQLLATQIHYVGVGSAQAQLAALVEKLRNAGMFAPTHKKPLPPFPQTVGLVTSQTGAAVHDMIKVLRKRLPAVKIILSPCQVQGEPLSIVRALQLIDDGRCDVILIGRGGGSRDDLAAFNDERVAVAVFNCQTPIISSVGHEIDISLCDLVADKRAATPSEAAEMATPDAAQLRRHLALYARNLRQAIGGYYQRARAQIERLQQLLTQRQPQSLIRRRQQQIDELAKRLCLAGENLCRAPREKIALLSARLAMMNPQAVLQRGYALVRDERGALVKSIANLLPNTPLMITFAQGRAWVKIVNCELEGD